MRSSAIHTFMLSQVGGTTVAQLREWRKKALLVTADHLAQTSHVLVFPAEHGCHSTPQCWKAGTLYSMQLMEVLLYIAQDLRAAN